MPTLNISNIQETSISWSISSLSSPFNQTYYKGIELRRGIYTSYITAPATGSSTSATGGYMDGLSPGVTYTVSAYAETKSAGFFFIESRVFTTPTPPPPIPSAPSWDYSKTVKTHNSITVGWYDNANTDYFEISMKNSSWSFWNDIGSIGYKLSQAFGSLDSNTTYYFRIRACNAAGCSAWVETIATTSAPPSPPTAPSNISWSFEGGTSNWNTYVQFNWSGAGGDKVYIFLRELPGNTYETYDSLNIGVRIIGFLKYSTAYTFFMQSYDSSTGLSSSQSSSYTFTTPGYPVPAVPSTPSVNKYDGYINVSWTSVVGATSYSVKTRRGYDNNTVYNNTSNSSVNVLSLQYGVTYYISVSASNSSGSSSYSTERTVTTLPKIPTLSAINKTTNEFTIQISNMEGNWDRVEVSLYNESNTFITKNTINNGNSTTRFTSLTLKKYIVRAYSYFNGTEGSTSSYSYSSLEVTLEDFQWKYSSIIQGGAAIIDHRDWNELTAVINSKRQARGLATVTFTQVSTGMDIMASYFNAVRNAISPMNPTIPLPSTKKGVSDSGSLSDYIRATDIDQIRLSLNSI